MRAALLVVLISGVAVFAALEFMPRGDGSSDATVSVATSPSRKSGQEFKGERTDAAQLARLNEEVERLKKKVDRLAHALQLAQASNRLRRADAVDSYARTKDDVAAEENDDDGDYRASVRRAELDRRFSTETTDSAWAERMAAGFQSALAKFAEYGLKGTELVYHECRTTLCSAEFVHGQGEDHRFLAVALAMPGVERMTVLPAETREGGSAVSKVYFFREGFAGIDAAE